jgi:hypothetical protein
MCSTVRLPPLRPVGQFARALERDKYAVRSGIGCRRGPDRAGRHNCRGKAASYAAEVVAVEKIDTRILAERQDEGLGAGARWHLSRWDIKEQRVAAAKIGIALVERPPVRRREKVPWLLLVT